MWNITQPQQRRSDKCYNKDKHEKMLKEISQTQMDKYCMILLIGGS